MKQAMIDLYDAYTHGRMGRRAFLERLAGLAGGAAAAGALLPLLESDPARAQTVAPDDPAILTRVETFASPEGPISGYLAAPADADASPGVLVIHENRGLNAHIEDVARRLAKQGFVALAPDLLSPAGGTPADTDAARTLIGSLDPAVALGAAVAAANHLATHPSGTGAVGAVGFCWGGGLVLRLAAAEAPVEAVVSYYGRQPDARLVGQIDAALMLHYAGLDQRVNAGIEAFRDALDSNEIRYRLFMYDGVNHAFNNDTNAARYDADAAALAWERTLALLRDALS